MQMNPKPSTFFTFIFLFLCFYCLLMVCYLFCSTTMVPYPQLLDQQESANLDPLSLTPSFLLPFQLRSEIKDLMSY